MHLADFLLLAGLVAVGSAVGWLASKVRSHRRLLDERIETLAEETRERTRSFGRTLNDLAERLATLELEQRLNGLESLLSRAERGGITHADAARGLDRALADLCRDARAGEE